MKITLRRLAGAACLALAITGNSAAQTCCPPSGACCDGGFCGPCCDTSCDACDVCCDPCGDGQSWGGFAEAEALFLRYHRDDGVRMGADAGEVGEFDFEPGVRYTLGVIAPGGLGFRTRFFEYDRFQGIENVAEGDGLGIDTFNVDAEVFDSMILGDVWAAEISAGARYNEFKEQMVDAGEFDLRTISFQGLGLVAGLELRRLVTVGHLYARVRGAVVQGDKGILNADGGFVNQSLVLFDTTHAVTEIAWGYEMNYALPGGATLFARSGVEWQNWANFSNHFDFVTGEDFFDGASDVGFAGFTLSGGVTY
jgi:hypothetical protein